MSQHYQSDQPFPMPGEKRKPSPVVATLTAEKRSWVDRALLALAYVCAFVSLVSQRAADALCDAGARIIAKYGFRVTVR